MNHIERLSNAVADAGLAIHVYVDNNHVFGLDIMSQVGFLDNKPLYKNVGHAVFSPIKSPDRLFLFLEGRIGKDSFQAVGKTADRALWEFESFIKEKVAA